MILVLIISYRRAIFGGTPEFLGQLIASLLVAQWLERWCTSLVAQVRFLACLFRVSYYKGKPDHAAAIYSVFVNYILINITPFLICS